MRKLYVLPIMLVIFALILSACAAPAAPAAPQVVKETVVVEQKVEVVQTQVVEKVVEKSVEVVVTATPEPPKPADANTLPRNETLYFNGQQWGPVVGWLLWRSVVVHELPAAGLLGIALAGLVVWTLSEYALHRFVFHYPATGRLGRYLVFMFHGVHHDAPRDKTRLVMPPAGAIIVMFVLWQLFRLVVPAPWIEPFCAFFIAGYLVYDYIHYATHHFAMKQRWLHYLKIYHLQHHYGAGQITHFVAVVAVGNLVK